MATYQEFNIDQGQSFNTTLSLALDTTNADYNLTDYTIKSQIKYSFYTSTVTDSFVCSIEDPIQGTISLSLASANTANIKAGRYVFDVFVTSPTGSSAKILEGLLVINPSVTNIFD